MLTHNYTGYPMVRQAREMVAAGELGALRVVQVEYPQDWLTTRLEETGQKQAAWRTDPARSGAAGCVGDIGTHAFNLAEFVTGLRCEALAAELSTFVPGRRLDDNAQMLLRFAGGARGALWCKPGGAGHENALRLRVFGERGGLEWVQEQPEPVWTTRSRASRPASSRRSGPSAGPAARHATRIPAGHPEGYLEAFAQLYEDAAALIRAHQAGREPDPEATLLPDVMDGLRGVRFIDAAIRSSRGDAAWTSIE